MQLPQEHYFARCRAIWVCAFSLTRTGTPSLRASRFIPDHGKACFTEMDKLAILSMAQTCPFPLRDIPLRCNRGELSFHYAALKGGCSCTAESEFGINFANSASSIWPQTVRKSPAGRSFSLKWVPNMLEGATCEKFFLLKTNQYMSCERCVGVSQANRRETRKLGLLLSND